MRSHHGKAKNLNKFFGACTGVPVLEGLWLLHGRKVKGLPTLMEGFLLLQNQAGTAVLMASFIEAKPV